MSFVKYIDYVARKNKLVKDGYGKKSIETMEGKLQETDDQYDYTKINGKPKNFEEYDANVKYLGTNKGKVITDIRSNLQYKDRILRIEEYRNANHRSSRMVQMDEGEMQAFPNDFIQNQFFEWTTTKANEIYNDLVKKLSGVDIASLKKKDKAAKLAEQNAKAKKNAENAANAADEKIYRKQVERTDYDDSDPEEVARRKRLIEITHLDKRDKDEIDFGTKQASGKIKRFWVDPKTNPRTEDNDLYDFYDKDYELGKLNNYKKGVTEYNDYFYIDIQYQGYLRKSDSRSQDDEIIITWYDEDEEYFNRQIKMKEAALKLSEGQIRNFWTVHWSDNYRAEYPNGRPFYTKTHHKDHRGETIIDFNYDEVPDYDLTRGDFFGVRIEKKSEKMPPPPAPSASVAAPPPAPPNIPRELAEIGWKYKQNINKGGKYDFDFKPDPIIKPSTFPPEKLENINTLPVKETLSEAQINAGWTSHLSKTNGYYYYKNTILEKNTYTFTDISGGKRTRKKGKGKGKTRKIAKGKKATKGKKNTKSKKAQRKTRKRRSK